MPTFFVFVAVISSGLVLVPGLRAQQGPTQPADTLILNDGERLIGSFLHATDTEVVFKSNIVGEVTVKWTSVTELHTSQKVAVIPKGTGLKPSELSAAAPQGTASANAQSISIATPSGQTVQMPIANTERMLDATTFEHDLLRRPGILEDWTGSLTAALAIVAATQNSRDLTTAFDLIRAIPGESWLEKRSRTELGFTSSYGTITQPGTPTVKTNIFHAAGQQDEYFSPSLFGFGQAIFDHNISQGLSLAQAYSAGIGWTALSAPNNTLDLKAGMSYARQSFESGPERNLVGSTFSENWIHKFGHGSVFSELLEVNPAWNQTNALLANGAIKFTMPVYKRLNFTTNLIDSYLADPPPGFRKNSVQFSTGISYSLR